MQISVPGTLLGCVFLQFLPDRNQFGYIYDLREKSSFDHCLFLASCNLSVHKESPDLLSRKVSENPEDAVQFWKLQYLKCCFWGVSSSMETWDAWGNALVPAPTYQSLPRSTLKSRPLGLRILSFWGWAPAICFLHALPRWGCCSVRLGTTDLD